MASNRIVHLSTVHHPHDTRILYRECTSLAENGYHVTLLVCSQTPVQINDINVITFPLPRNRIIRMSFTAFRFLIKSLQLNADIYHFHDPELIPWMLLLRLTGKKIIFDVHENIIGSLTDREWIAKPILPLILKTAKLFLPIIMKPFHIIFAEYSYPKIYNWIKKYEVVCNFPKTKHFPSNNSNLPKYPVFSVVYIGGITQPRGIFDMLDALKILQDRGVEVDFYLIGKVHLPNRMTIEDLIKERSLMRVNFFGYKPQPEALEIIARCHVGLAVLHPVENYIISYPTKIFEYMGCGVAFITSNFPLYQEVVDKWQCGVTVKPQSPQALADSIEILTKNPKKILKMGKQGIQAVENEYNWSFEEKKLLSLYKRILS